MNFFNQLANGLSQRWNAFTQELEWSRLHGQSYQLCKEGKFTEAFLVAEQALILGSRIK